MSTNNNLTYNVVDIFKFVFSKWRHFWGCLLVMAIEDILMICLPFPDSITIPVRLGILPGAFVITFFVWTISTDRWFHRSSYWALLWITLFVGAAFLFGYVIYSTCIKDTIVDISYIQWWGSILVFVILFVIYYVLDFKLLHQDRRVILFLVADASKYEEQVKSILNEARHRIQSIDQSIIVIIPPFGIAKSISACEKYINGWFCQADAIVYARLIEGNSESEFKFVDFTSRMNIHRIPKKRDNINVGQILTDASKCKDWNTLNKNDNAIAIKEIMASDLAQLLLIYVGCILLYKMKYSVAIPVVDKLFEFDNIENPVLNSITNNMMSYAYLTAAQWEEQQTLNYQQSLDDLEACKKKLPQVVSMLKYKLAMARVMMHLGKIQESMKFTKSITPSAKATVGKQSSDTHEYDWYIRINLAYYAIYDRKPKEVFSNYKALLKTKAPAKEEVDFAIWYQLNELKKNPDDQYRMFLFHGLAFLHLYLDINMSKSFLTKA